MGWLKAVFHIHASVSALGLRVLFSIQQRYTIYLVTLYHSLLGLVVRYSIQKRYSLYTWISLSLVWQCRIVGLSASLANAKDVGDWIGATAHSLVSFRPDVRPVVLELKLHGFDVNHFGSRMLAMAKPAYNYVALGCAGGCGCGCGCGVG